MISLLIVLLLITIYFYGTKNRNYWLKRNIKHVPPVPLFGNFLPNILGFKSVTETAVELYKRYPEEKVIGFYKFTTPELIVKDLDIIRKIMTVDFAYFYRRGLGRNPDVEPLHGNLFHVDGDKWKLLRKRLTPAFTTAKLRAMFPLIVRCAERLQAMVSDLSENGTTYDARELMARFATEFIGACGFGIEMDSLSTERSQFRELGKLIFRYSARIRVLRTIWETFPEARKFIRVESDEIEQNIKALLEQIKQQRNYKPIGRHDFIDLLLELEAKGKIVGDSVEKINSDGSPALAEMEMDLNSQAAQVYVFFAAGFETSSSATSFALHTLAFHPEIQKEIQEEIDAVMLKYNNSLCYDAIAEMTKLDMAFKESSRMFTSVGTLNRVCTRRYKFPELDITIDPGVKIVIPVQAIHMDEKYYDNPTEFRPERFTPEEIRKRHLYAYLPFGEGPRSCIGARLGHMQSLAGLAAILHKFTVEPADTTVKEIRVKPSPHVLQSVDGGLPLSFKARAIETEM